MIRLVPSGKTEDDRKIGEIADLAQPTMSHHIKLLVDVGLVNAEKDGQLSFFI